jgi:hypothetical protein
MEHVPRHAVNDGRHTESGIGDGWRFQDTQRSLQFSILRRREASLRVTARHPNQTCTGPEGQCKFTNIMKILPAAIASLLVSPMSSHAAYHLYDHMISPGHIGSIWSCANEMYREPDLKLAIAHFNAWTGSVHCYLFGGRMRPGESQVIKFDGIASTGNFGALRGNPNVITVHARCRMNMHAGVYAQPRYRYRLASGGVTGGYDVQVPVQSGETYQSAQVLLTGYRYITRDCVSASG